MDIKIKEEIVKNLIKKFEKYVNKCESYQSIDIKDDYLTKIYQIKIHTSGIKYGIYYNSDYFEIEEKDFLRLQKLATDKRLELFLKEIKE